MKRFTLMIGVVLMIGTMAFGQEVSFKPTKVSKAAYFDKSEPLRDIEPVEPGERDRSWKENKVGNKFIEPYSFDKDGDDVVDPVVQRALGRTQVLGPIQNFEGMGNLNGVYPPDTDGAVGPDHYFQMINLSFKIYDKQGNTVYGPADNSTLWDGFIGPWTGTNDGDPIITYDEIADRWVATQFAVNTGNGTDYELVAVSTTPDPTGEYYRYAFAYDNFNDYPKVSVWPDAYVVTYNMFGDSYLGAGVAAFDREAMLEGDPEAEQQFFQLSSSYYGMLPAEFDGTPPPEGSPAYLTHMKRTGSRGIHLFEFVVDWETPSNSSVDLVQTLDPGSYSTFSIDGGVPQPGTDNVLDDFVGQAMYRLAYRNFGDHESMVMNHGVVVNSNHALRWYELRKEGDDDWEIHQQSTFAPDDGLHRWMGSIAMNGDGDIAIGYSVSSEDVYPSLRYTARTSDAPLGEMNIGEIELKAGTGSQTGINRWGDYASMTVDPSDDETFWFTGQFVVTGWKTQISAFNLQPIAPPVVDAGPDTIICSGNLYNTSPASAESASSYEWTTSGDGNFVPNNSELEVNYLRGDQDIENGGAWLYVTAFGFDTGMQDQDSLYLTIMSDPSVNAGPDTTICEDDSYITESEVENASEILWATNGDGTFDDPTIADATYIPGEEDIANGQVELNVSVIPIAPCEGTDEDQIVLSFEICSDIDDLENIESIAVYPNPSKGVINVAMEGVKSNQAVIEVTNTAGVTVYNNQIDVRGDRVDHQIDLTDQPEGIYLVKTTVNNETVTRKVIVR